jgi:single-strand DNA-binding protein
MFDTYVTVVGNVLTTPHWRRTSNTNSLVANFKIASTARRLDRENGRWVDGNSLRVRVNCWRKLAEGVASSVMVGDPVVVVGRLYTRDWTDSEGTHRTLYELEAVAVGHDLARGRARFFRNKPKLATSEVSDEEADARVNGQPTEPVPDGEIPVQPVELDDADGDFADLPVPPRSGTDELTQLRGGGFDPTFDAPAFDDPVDEDPSDDPLAGDPAEGPSAEIGGGSGDNPGDDAGDDPAGETPDDDPADDPQRVRGRSRRGRSRETVPV